MSDRDPFDDMPAEVRGYGALDGDAVKQHYGSTESIGREGVTFKLQCQKCGQGNQLVVSWPEVILMSMGRVPQGWEYNQGLGGFVLRAGACVGLGGGCREMLPIVYLPDSAQRQIKTGLANRVLDPALVQQIQKQVAAQYGR